jgi:hypothetical protein
MFNCITMLAPRVLIYFQLTAMAPKGCRQEQAKTTGRAKMPTLVVNLCLSLNHDLVKGLISEHIHGLILIYNVCSMKDERAWDRFCNIMCLDPFTTRQFSQIHLMWPHCRSSSSPFWEWWAAVYSYFWQMFDKTGDQINNWRWDNPQALGDQVNFSKQQTTTSGQV